MSEIRYIEIDPALWYCGEGGMLSKLLRPDDKMCCLGFKQAADGQSADDYRNKSYPCEVPDEELSWEADGIMFNTDLACELMRINDEDNGISIDERLSQLNEACRDYEANFRFRFRLKEK